MSDFSPAKTGLSRVFVIPGRARPDHTPEYMSCLRSQALSKSFGDVEDIECPHPTRPGAYIKVGEIQGAEERATVTLEGRYALEVRSELLKWASRRCPVDVQLHFGDCEDLSVFPDFKKAVILEDALLGSYDTENLGSLESPGEAAINEMVAVSARVLYDIIALSFGEEGEDVVTNQLVDVVICDDISCGGCAEESDGCQKIYSISLAAGGSPGTPPDVVFSLDGGDTWYAHDIDSLGAAEDPTGAACIGPYFVVVSNDSASLHYTETDDITDAIDPTFTEIATGFVASGEPNDIYSVGGKAWVVGDGGYVYVLIDPPSGVTVQDAGLATIEDLQSVHALNRNFAVAAGNAGAIIVSEDGESWAAAPSSPVGIGTQITVIRAKSRTQWFIGTDAGDVYYTLDGGETWTIKAFPGSGTGVVEDIDFASDSIVYISHTTAATRGRLLASFDGGHEFVVLPQDVGVLPASDEFTAIAACKADPGLLVAVGLADDGSDGIIVVGQM